MDVLQKEIDEVYATQLIADEILDNGVVEQHQRFIHSLTEINGGCAVISDLSNRKSYIVVHPWAHFLGLLKPCLNLRYKLTQSLCICKIR